MKFQVPISYCFGVKVFEDLEEDRSVTESINHRGVCRTATATLGPLNTSHLYSFLDRKGQFRQIPYTNSTDQKQETGYTKRKRQHSKC